MIISASRRTDIPAFYAEWFLNRIYYVSGDVTNPESYQSAFTSGSPCSRA